MVSIKEINKLILIRHGSTDLNESSLLMSNSDPGLSLLGQQQVCCLSREIEGYLDSSFIIASPTKRARETADAICKERPYVLSDELCERDLGSWEGLSVQEIKKRRCSEGLGLIDITQNWIGCLDVEQDESVWKRSWNSIDRLSANETSNTTIVITHAGVIKSLVCKMLAIDVTRHRAFRITLGGMMLFEQHHGLFELQKLWPNPLATPSKME